MYSLAAYRKTANRDAAEVFPAAKALLLGIGSHLVECHLLIEGWPKAKKFDATRLESELIDAGNIKSIEAKFQGEIGCVQLLVRNDASQLLFIGTEINDKSVPLILLREISEKFSPCYGYLYECPLGHSALYAAGITYSVSGDVEDSIADADERWFSERVMKNSKHRYCSAGMLRDVYESNLINESHLSANVDGVRLAEVIVLRNWGYVEKIGENRWLWEVPVEVIPEVRRSCFTAGILI